MFCSICEGPIGPISYRTGDAVLCNECAAKYPLSTLYSICAVENIASGIVRNIAEEVEGAVVGLAGQTEEAHLEKVENPPEEMTAKIAANAEYGEQVREYLASKEPPAPPYGMKVIQPQYKIDYGLMSSDDYVDKYCDDPEALDYFQSMKDDYEEPEEEPIISD